MSSNNIHDEWLSLVEISGPFLAPPVLNEAFPQGLDFLDPAKRKRLRQTYEEWREALDTEDPEFAKLHQAWIREVISNCLGFDEDGRGAHLKFGTAIPPALALQIPEQGVTLAPEYVLVNEQKDNWPLLLIQSYTSGVDLQASMSVDGWSASPVDRMVQLCRLMGCRLGLVTDGERWMLVDAPVGAVTTFASWYARLWIQEPITLQAFVHLLGIRRFFVATGAQIPALIDKSLQHQDEVTTALGEQVQRAVEVLIQSLDRADQDRNRELLKDVTPAELYEAGLTVMMRLVFLLSAEERGLLLMGDECYEENYAISTLRMQLRSESEEILERRWDAWSRLLSVFRAVYGGIDYENMRLPALGGSLFDPDRFPFLEGRAKGSDWRIEPAKPLPIDNRTVLLLLEAIQQYQGRNLSYRALDVEQIGYVYEGLLERTVKRTSEVILDVGATRSAANPLVSLVELESLKQSGESALLDYLVERTGSSIARVRNALSKPVDDQLSDRLLAACMGNIDLRNQIKPFANLLRIDLWGYPLVYPADSFVVALGSDRRETGSHYTPKSLTETIVTETLTPVVYVGPAEGLDRNEWRLKSPEEILQLKICDPAMGSGAFLVQVCRFLSDRLIEAWGLAEIGESTISADGEVINGGKLVELMPADVESRTVIARRLIAERCLYGVDLNPLAVELAKLSIWLITFAKDRPFGFLDHNLRCGDSLIGVYYLNQLLTLNMLPSMGDQPRLFGRNIDEAVSRAISVRNQIRSIPIRNIRDVEAITLLDKQAQNLIRIPNLIADSLVGEYFSSKGDIHKLDASLSSLSILSERCIEGDELTIKKLEERVKSKLSIDLAPEKAERNPFHWPLEFPEVFVPPNGGFDAIIGNPPYLGGKKISAVTGSAYREYLVTVLAKGMKGNADLLAYFLLRIREIRSKNGFMGMVCTNSIAEGDTRQVSLDAIISKGDLIISANTDIKWPGSAAITVTTMIITGDAWSGVISLNNELATQITPYLKTVARWSPVKLSSNKGFAFQGSIILGTGFIVEEAFARNLLKEKPEYDSVLLPYLGGRDVNSSPTHLTNRWVICFWDWDEERASKYTELFSIVRELVKPERDLIKTNNSMSVRYKKLWWLFGRDVKNLYHRIGRGEHFTSKLEDWKFPALKLDKVIACATQASKYCCFTMLDNNGIFANSLCVIADERFSTFAILSSSIHSSWAWEYGSRMEQRLRYSHGDVYETFPFPEYRNLEVGNLLEQVGKEYLNLRSSYMIANHVGMTSFYNIFHDLSHDSSQINDLRKKQEEIDLLVLKSYGWSDINLNYGYHSVPYLPLNDRIRFTLSEDARIEILQRLSQLNKNKSESKVSSNKKSNGNPKKAHGKGSDELVEQQTLNF